MFRNSGENALNRFTLVSFFIGAERDSLHTFSADVFDQPVIRELKNHDDGLVDDDRK